MLPFSDFAKAKYINGASIISIYPNGICPDSRGQLAGVIWCECVPGPVSDDFFI